MFCALQAAQYGFDVVLLEKNKEVGKKILVSGGGRCNFTNLNTTPDDFRSGNPHFPISALSRFSPRDFLDWFEDLGLHWEEKAPGQLFCREGARALQRCFVQRLEEASVELITQCDVTGIEARDDGFLVKSSHGDHLSARVVVASGGLSWPALGVSDIGYQIARKFQHQVTPLVPGLVPILLDEDETWRPELSGISLEAEVSIGAQSYRGDLLFTHRGISGPVVLNASNHWPGPLSIDLLPSLGSGELFEGAGTRSPKLRLRNLLQEHLPRRLAEQLTAAENPPIAQLSKSRRREWEERLKGWKPEGARLGGYNKAEVTLGGVELGEVSSKTLESNHQPKLYFIGEVLDVTGQLGGYNFQWAWASAHAVTQHILGA